MAENKFLSETGLRKLVERIKDYNESSISSVQTKLDTIEEGAQKNVQADWNENDPVADGYVKNRPFYEDGNIVEIMPKTEGSVTPWEETGTGSYNTGFLVEPIGELTIGETYTVNWGGTEYKVIAKAKNSEDGLALGNLSILDFGEDTGEPFLIDVLPNFGGATRVSAQPWHSDDAAKDGSVTVSVHQGEMTIHTIEGKFLPKGTPWIGKGEDKTEILPETALDMSAEVQPYKLGLVAGESYTVVINGVEYECEGIEYTEDVLTCVILGDIYTASGGAYGSGATGEPFVIIEYPSELTAEMGIAGAFMFAPFDETMIDENTGTVSLSIYGRDEIVHKLDPRCLPDEVATKSDVFGYDSDITWDGVYDGMEYFQSGEYIFCKVSDYAPSVEEVIGETMTVSSGESAAISESDITHYTGGFSAHYGMIFSITDNSMNYGSNTFTQGLWFMYQPSSKSYVSSLTLSLVHIEGHSHPSLEEAISSLEVHVDRTDNPHGVTAEQVGAYTKSEVDAALSKFDGVQEQLDNLAEQLGTIDLSGLETKSDATAKLEEAKSYADTSAASAASGKADKATTLSGYGITDAYTKAEVDSAVSEKANSQHTHDVATPSLAGLMSAADKAKLNGIAANANKTTVDSVLSNSSANPIQNQAVYVALAGKSNTGHAHNDLYYTEEEIDSKISTINDSMDGKENTGVASSLVSSHNTSTSSHSDIRDLISALSKKVTDFLNVSDADFDTLGELIEYIEANRESIEAFTTSKVNVSDVINNLTTNVSNKPLSAAQGVVLKGLIDALQDEVDANESSISTHAGKTDNPHKVTAAQVGAYDKSEIDSKVSTINTAIDGKAAKATTLSGYGITDAYTKTQVDSTLKSYMTKSNPTGTGSLSLNRKSSTDIGDYSVAEGYSTTASATSSHAEGSYTTASGLSSHAEGSNTTASGNYSHAEGVNTTAFGSYSHAEGYGTTASGSSSHAEGTSTAASGDYSHAEGSTTIASGAWSHAEGLLTTASGSSSHAEGQGTTAHGQTQHVQGKYNIEDASSKYAHIVGNGSSDAPSNAHTLDWNGNAWYSGAIKIGGTSYDDASKVLTASDIIPSDWNENDTSSPAYIANRPFYTEDPVLTSLIYNRTITLSDYNGIGYVQDPFVLTLEDGSDYVVTWNDTNYNVTCSTMSGIAAIGNGSIAGVGADTGEPFLIGYADDSIIVYSTSAGSAKVRVQRDDAEVHKINPKYIDMPEGASIGMAGSDTGAEIFNNYQNNTASGEYSHAEGNHTTASGDLSHAEGSYTTASGKWSHSEGYHTTASADYSHAEGYYTKASSEAQHVQGQFNIEDTAKTYLHIVGNGEDGTHRSNAHTLDWSGNAWYKGTIKVGGTSYADASEVATKAYIEELLGVIENGSY